MLTMARSINIAAVALSILATAQAQVQLYNLTAVDGVSSTCAGVLNQQVQCDSLLLSASNALDGQIVFGSPIFFSSSQLTTLCTKTCSDFLATWERRVAQACGTTLYTQPDGGKFSSTSLAESYVELYNSVCLKNTAGAFCNQVIGQGLKIDPANQKPSATPDASIVCDDCYLSLLSTQLAMPMASTSILASEFQSLTSSCKKTGWTTKVPPTDTTFTVRPTPVSTTQPTCSGVTYTIAQTDTCVSISMSQGISTDDLLSWNVLPGKCYNFPSGLKSLCIPSSRKCTPYTVQSGDTCASLQNKFQIQYAKLISWNPSLGQKCSNLDKYVGLVICSTNPGGAWVNPTGGPTTTTTTARPSDPPLWTGTLKPFSSYPNATYVGHTTDIPYGNLTRGDCATYITAPILTNVSYGNTSFACQDVADQYGIQLSDFLSWNPSLTGSPCTMTNNTQYCAQTYATISPDIVGTCVMYETAPSGYDCNRFTSQYGLDPSQFNLWNPAVGSQCEKFTVGTKYCIAVSHYKQPGTTSNCNKFAMANDTEWANHPCQQIETQFGISHARFIAWNPALKDNCTGMYPGYDYCVSTPNYKPTYTTPTGFVAATANAMDGQGTLVLAKSNATVTGNDTIVLRTDVLETAPSTAVSLTSTATGTVSSDAAASTGTMVADHTIVFRQFS